MLGFLNAGKVFDARKIRVYRESEQSVQCMCMFKFKKENQHFEYFSNIFRIIIVIGFMLSLFFISGFIVIKSSISDKKEFTLPQLVGKLYLDAHNSLSSFNVVIKKAHFLEYPFGYILSQNPPAGAKVKEGSEVTLVVNQSDTILKTPDLRGISIDLVEKNLVIPIDNREYKLRKGSVTYVVSDKNEKEVLAQFPPPNTPVPPEYPVALLVSAKANTKENTNDEAKESNNEESKEKNKKKDKKTANLNLDGIHVEIAKKAAFILQKPLAIKPVEVKNANQDGIIISSETNQAGSKSIISVNVGRLPSKLSEDLPYRLIWLDGDDFPKGDLTFSMMKTTGNLETAISIANQIDSENNNKWYVHNNGNPIPVFKQVKDNLHIWKGHFIENSSYDHDYTSQKAKTISALDVEEKPETPEIEPIETIELDSYNP